jgi:hypothetical protein
MVGYCCHALLPRTVGATVERALRLDPVADDFAAAMLAQRSELVNGALEAVERMGLSGGDDLEGAIVVVATDLTPSHGPSSITGHHLTASLIRSL